MDLFCELNEAGSTILLITHDRQLARQASRVVYIDDGQLSSGDTVNAQVAPGETVIPAQPGATAPQQGVSP